jgi:hypothetical protein
MKALLKALPVLSALIFATPALAQSKEEEGKIWALTARREQAWNRHDMKALAALCTGDADYVNVGARHWKGRKEVEWQHAARLNQFPESVWETKEVTVQFLWPDVALVHVAWGGRRGGVFAQAFVCFRARLRQDARLRLAGDGGRVEPQRPRAFAHEVAVAHEASPIRAAEGERIITLGAVACSGQPSAVT